jgi:hypothetical protein
LRADHAVGTEVLRVLKPLGIDAAVKALDAQAGETSAAKRQLELALQRARFEAAHARRQYDAVDPTNRLVAGELERRWNETLQAVRRCQCQAFHVWKFEFDKQLATHQLDTQVALAEKKFQLDAALADRKRRQDLAEEPLSGFYQARNVLQAVRSPMSFEGEGAGRPRRDYENEAQARGRDTYFVPLARLKDHGEFLSGLMSKRYRAQAVVGPEIGRAFQTLHEVVVAIQVSADALIQMSGLDVETRRKFERDIWWTNLANDPLDQKVQGAVQTVEAVCRPILVEATQ